MQFFNTEDMKHEIVEGNVDRYIYTGDSMQIVEYRFPPNKVFPEHKHDDHEQMGRLIKGKMGFKVGNEERILLPGDFYHVEKGVMHSSWTFNEESVLLDIFTPPRDDLK
ncbi:MAG: cupin domain-containing protein [Spirochaetes bacterium]|nr:cupin domain-containing protein [Spirochaetota bacterium]